MAAKVQFPTSKDIYLEVDGKKIAVVQSYKVRTQKDTKPVESFGEEDPVGQSRGRKTHTIDITRVYVTDAGIKDGIDFHTMENFTFVIAKPDNKIIYTGCDWTEIGEDASLNETVAENVSISATKRIVEKL